MTRPLDQVRKQLGDRIADLNKRAARLSPLDIHEQMDAIREVAAVNGLAALESLAHRSSQEAGMTTKPNTPARDPQIEQPLFAAKGPDGHQYSFGVLTDGRCAIACDGKLMRAWGHDQLGIDSAIDQFCALTDPQEPRAVSDRVHAFALQSTARPKKSGLRLKRP